MLFSCLLLSLLLFNGAKLEAARILEHGEKIRRREAEVIKYAQSTPCDSWHFQPLFVAVICGQARGSGDCRWRS